MDSEQMSWSPEECGVRSSVCGTILGQSPEALAPLEISTKRLSNCWLATVTVVRGYELVEFYHTSQTNSPLG